MGKNKFLSGKKIKRAVCVLLAAVMLPASVISCGTAAIENEPQAECTYVFENAKTEEALIAFLDVYCKWYAASPYGNWNFDSSDATAGRGNMLACIAASKPCVDWSLYSDVSFEDRFIENANDPRGWASETVSYYVFDAKTVEFIAGQIFNISSRDIDKLILDGERNRLFYKHNEKYYTLSDENRQSFVSVSSLSVKENGERYTVKFIASGACEQNDEGLVRVEYRRCTADMALKRIEGREYWSLYQFASEES
ncbi:MAG: hypothetical protein IJM51_03770 [Clostridia bacterium]|nr:hypothetical protein [Clostridia bacterium]